MTLLVADWRQKTPQNITFPIIDHEGSEAVKFFLVLTCLHTL